IEVARSNTGIFISQRKYVLDLLDETGMLDCSKPLETPMDPNQKLMIDDGDVEDPMKNLSFVGKLNYLIVTHPYIAFPVSVVSQFLSSPRSSHWDVVIRILRYFKGSPGRGLLHCDQHHRVEGFSDADWTGSPSDRRFTTGYCVFVGGNLVSWKSKKQSVVTRSSVESEYRAMANVTCELMWTRQLLSELGFGDPSPMQLWCDNQAAIHIGSNPVFHKRTKHIEVDYHFIREKLQQKLISTDFVKTAKQLADVFTKSLGNGRIKTICNKLGIYGMYAPTRGGVLDKDKLGLRVNYSLYQVVLHYKYNVISVVLTSFWSDTFISDF
ncbi:LOW QUALITY PROTEIN: hypothetical protein CFOL_v3_02884, partial [Cephalotus follicularis]